MQIESEVIRENRDGFRSGNNAMAPRPAVATFLELAPNVVPLSFAEWAEPGQRGAIRWTVIGRDQDRLVVVTAAAPTTWTWEDREPIEGATASGRLVPIRRISAVGLCEVSVRMDGFDMGALWGQGRWVILLDDGEEIRLNDPQSGLDEGRAATFCRSIELAR